MSGPSWLADMLAVVMIATAAYCFSRLVGARRWRRPTDYDVDGVHVLMGVAMAGMLVPRLNPFWDSGWEVIFGAAGAWFGWQTIYGYRNQLAVGRRWVTHHLQHLVACGAMVYMFLGVSPAKTGRYGPGMALGGPAGSAGTFPTLAVVLALALLAYVISTADRFTSLAPVAALRAVPASVGAAAASALVASPASLAVAEPTAGGATTGAGQAGQAGSGSANGPSPALARPPISPRLAACCDIVMGLTMGYVLITML